MSLLPLKALAAGAAGWMMVAAAWSAFPAAQSSSSPSEPGGYVDSAVCAGCHGEIARSYAATGMGRSFSLPDSRRVGEDFGSGATVYQQDSDLHYTLSRHDGKLYQKRFETGPQGEPSSILEESVDYVIGSGNHARTFLHRDAQGRLIELPVSWYTEAGGYFAMSPGFERRDQDDFRRAIPGECMFCHNAYPRAQGGPERGSLDPPRFPANLPEGIDCQRCHGPGEAHVKAASSGAGEETIRAAIVNPARLSRDRQLEVCMQCHLETSSSHMPNEIRRYGRSLDSYRPGQPLGNYKLYFKPVAAAGEDDSFEIAHAAYRLRMSACFRNSQMTCLTCHDPHQSYKGPEMSARYVAVCQKCHQAVTHKVALPADRTCIDCHMPARRTDDAVHVVMTDHYIQRIKPDRDLLAKISETAADQKKSRGVALYYPPQIAPSPENDLYLSLADVMDGSHGKPAIERLRVDVVKAAPEQPEFYFELAHAMAKAGEREPAIHWYEEALRRRADYPAASKELALLLLAHGEASRAETVLDKAVGLAPGDDQLLADLGNVYLREGRVAEAQQALEKALDLNPEGAEAANLMGLIAMKKGDSTKGEEWFRRAIQMDPELAEARKNLARLLVSGRNYQEAAFEYRKETVAAPNDAEAHHNYALMLELTKGWDEALRQLQEAARLNGRDAQVHEDLADLLAARGDLDSAAGEYRRAVAANPAQMSARMSLGDLLQKQNKLPEAEQQFRAVLARNPAVAEAHVGLALVLARQGNLTAAAAEAREAEHSSDPDVRQAAQELLRQMGKP